MIVTKFNCITQEIILVEEPDVEYPVETPVQQLPSPEERLVHVEATQAAIIEVLATIAGVTI